MQHQKLRGNHAAILAASVTFGAVACGGLQSAWAQNAAPSLTLPTTEIEAPVPPETLPTDAATSKTVSGESMRERPAMRPGEYLEITPGLIATQHSGEGKANQYYLRGFNLDHGTDLAISVDGMPANMRTHGHGQGYADIGFLIPELVDTLSYRKGPYFAEEGDFASAGAIHLDYVDKLEKNIVSGTVGSFGYYRGLAAGSVPMGQGTVTGAGEVTFYDGPWQNPDDLRRYNGLLRYAQGNRRNGFSLTGMGSSAEWNSTDQIPSRAVESGQLDRFGAIDVTDGGDTSRYSLSARWAESEAGYSTKLSGYAMRSNLNLYNNFTYFLDDPVNGDQFKQKDERTTLGLNASHTMPGEVGGKKLENTVGMQTRYDDIGVGLFRTAQWETSPRSARTTCRSSARASMARQKCSGPIGSAPPSACAETGTTPMSTATMPRTRATPAISSQAPSSAPCSVRSPARSSSPTPAADSTATTCAARPSRSTPTMA